MNFIVEKDWEWFLAKVIWRDDIYAFGYSEQEAKKELLNVIEMVLDIHLDQIEIERKLKKEIFSNLKAEYAI